MTVLFYECYTVLFKIFSEGAYLKQALNGSVISEKNRAKVTKIVYGVLDKNIQLEYYLGVLCSKNPKNAVKIILKIALYNLKYLNKQPYAVTDATVSLLKKMGKGGTAGFANALLRKFSKQEIELPVQEIKRLSVEYSYPEFIIEKLLKKYSVDEVKSIISYDKVKTCLRFNESGEDYLKQRGINYQTTPFKEVFLLDNFKMDEGFYEGIYTFQSIGSVAICDIASGRGKLLDTCSAPGGKAINLARCYSEVTAWDVHEHRVELIRSYAKRMRVSVNAQVQDATLLNESLINSFDTVLCDVPCSGTGVIYENPDIKLNRTAEAVNQLTKTQFDILKICSNYVKVGGCLIYSTCSVLPEENEQNIEKFLEEGGFTVDMPNSKLCGRQEKFGITFLPNISQGAGFYCCRLRRIK